MGVAFFVRGNKQTTNRNVDLCPARVCIFAVFDWENIEPRNRNVEFALGEFDGFDFFVEANEQTKHRNVDFSTTSSHILVAFDFENVEPPNRNVDCSLSMGSTKSSAQFGRNARTCNPCLSVSLFQTDI